MDGILKEAIKENIENANRQIANLSENIHFVKEQYETIKKRADGIYSGMSEGINEFNELIKKKNILKEMLEKDNA
jgi:prophage DNA circulation protein